MVEAKSDASKQVQNLVFRASKASAKAVIFYATYFILWSVLAPTSDIVLGFRQMVETLVIGYILLMIVGELTSGTIYQHFFNGAKALFVICYLILSLNGGMVGLTYQNVELLIDLRMFLMIVTLLGLLGFAKSLLQGMNYLIKNTESSTV